MPPFCAARAPASTARRDQRRENIGVRSERGDAAEQGDRDLAGTFKAVAVLPAFGRQSAETEG